MRHAFTLAQGGQSQRRADAIHVFQHAHIIAVEHVVAARADGDGQGEIIVIPHVGGPIHEVPFFAHVFQQAVRALILREVFRDAHHHRQHFAQEAQIARVKIMPVYVACKLQRIIRDFLRKGTDGFRHHALADGYGFCRVPQEFARQRGIAGEQHVRVAGKGLVA